jgi:hypothetical protein
MVAVWGGKEGATNWLPGVGWDALGKDGCGEEEGRGRKKKPNVTKKERWNGRRF